MKLTTENIIRFDFDDTRVWIAIHYKYVEDSVLRCQEKIRKHVKDQTGYFLFGLPAGDRDYLASNPYRKCAGILHRGHFANMSIVGNISNPEDRKKYKQQERI